MSGIGIKGRENSLSFSIEHLKKADHYIVIAMGKNIPDGPFVMFDAEVAAAALLMKVADISLQEMLAVGVETMMVPRGPKPGEDKGCDNVEN